MSILNYFFIGFAFTFIVDVFMGYKPIKNNLKIKDITWGVKERLVCVLIWPLAALVFVISFIKQFLQK